MVRVGASRPNRPLDVEPEDVGQPEVVGLEAPTLQESFGFQCIELLLGEDVRWEWRRRWSCSHPLEQEDDQSADEGHDKPPEDDPESPVQQWDLNGPTDVAQGAGLGGLAQCGADHDAKWFGRDRAGDLHVATPVGEAGGDGGDVDGCRRRRCQARVVATRLGRSWSG